jgi:hypothetical protein
MEGELTRRGHLDTEFVLGTTILTFSIFCQTFYSLLEDWFKEKRGYDMVRRREYTIEEEITQRIFETDKPLKAYLRRGMRITMSMLYLIRGRVERVCPRCRTRFPGSTQRTQW